jgi:DNA-binding NarL/FixJ family response regulator
METRILIADDDSRVLQKVSTCLQQYPEFGRILVAKDGREAVDKAQIYRPDAVILDLSMPGMNGIEAARWVHKASPTLPIVLLTFHQAEADSLRSAGISAV